MAHMTMMWKINNDSQSKVLDKIRECKPGEVVMSPSAIIFGMQWTLHIFPNGTDVTKLNEFQCFANLSMNSKHKGITHLSVKTRLSIDECPHLSPTKHSLIRFDVTDPPSTYCKPLVSNFKLSDIVHLDTLQLTLRAQFELCDIISTYGSIKTLWLQNPDTALETQRKQTAHRHTSQHSNTHTTNNNTSAHRNIIKSNNRIPKKTLKTLETRAYSMESTDIKQTDKRNASSEDEGVYECVSHRRHHTLHLKDNRTYRKRRHSRHSSRERYNDRHRRDRDRDRNRSRDRDRSRDKDRDRSRSRDRNRMNRSRATTKDDAVLSDIEPTYPYNVTSTQITQVRAVNHFKQIKQMLRDKNKEKELMHHKRGLLRVDEFNKYKKEMYAWGDKLMKEVNDRMSQLEQTVEAMESKVSSMEHTAPRMHMDGARKRLKQWFHDCVKLPQYFEVFVQNGFENMSFLSLIGSNELNDMDITKMGHQMQILSEIQRVKDSVVDSAPPATNM